jgi:hypothetical protein
MPTPPIGVLSGVNQRSVQVLLGHSDPRMTVNIYTDVPILNLGAEVAKLPDFSPQPAPQKLSKTAILRFSKKLF